MFLKALHSDGPPTEPTFLPLTHTASEKPPVEKTSSVPLGAPLGRPLTRQASKASMLLASLHRGLSASTSAPYILAAPTP